MELWLSSTYPYNNVIIIVMIMNNYIDNKSINQANKGRWCKGVREGDC